MEVASGDIRPPPASHGNRQTQNPREPRIHNQLPPTAGELLAGSGSSGPTTRQRNAMKCIFCAQSHWSDECPKYTTLRSRMEKLKGTSFKCLQRGHTMKECHKQWSCAHCSKHNHHRSLCPKPFSSEGRSNVPEGHNDSSSSSTEGAMVTTGNQVLMQTATAKIKNIVENFHCQLE